MISPPDSYRTDVQRPGNWGLEEEGIPRPPRPPSALRPERRCRWTSDRGRPLGRSVLLVRAVAAGACWRDDLTSKLRMTLGDGSGEGRRDPHGRPAREQAGRRRPPARPQSRRGRAPRRDHHTSRSRPRLRPLRRRHRPRDQGAHAARPRHPAGLGHRRGARRRGRADGHIDDRTTVESLVSSVAAVPGVVALASKVSFRFDEGAKPLTGGRDWRLPTDIRT